MNLKPIDFKRARGDVVVAAAVLMASLLLSSKAYFHISAASLAQRQLSFTIPEDGQRSYIFLQHGKCIGTFTTSRELEGTDTNLYASGKIHLATHDRSAPVAIKGHAYFNSLKQLGGALLQAIVDDRGVLIGSSGVNPLALKVRTYGPGYEREFKHIIPGPIILTTLSDDTLTLSSPHFLGQDTNKLNHFAGGLAKNLDLNLRPTDDPTLACEEAGMAHFNIRALAHLAKLVPRATFHLFGEQR